MVARGHDGNGFSYGNTEKWRDPEPGYSTKCTPSPRFPHVKISIPLDMRCIGMSMKFVLWARNIHRGLEREKNNMGKGLCNIVTSIK